MVNEKTIYDLIRGILPEECNVIVAKGTNFFGGDYIKIAASVGNHDINKVKGQKVQLVSLSYEIDSMDLEVQVFGGSGGRSVYRIPDEEHRFYAMQPIKVPFRKPKKTEKSIMGAIEKFFTRYLQILKENRDVLMHQDLVDYSFLDGKKMKEKC